jgi:hypothetical protein
MATAGCYIEERRAIGPKPVALRPPNNMKPYSAFPIAIGAVCLTMALHELMIWLRRRGKGFDLSFAVTCLIAGLYDLACAGEYSVDAAVQSIPWLRAEAVALNLTALAFLGYLSGRTRKVPRAHLLAFSGWTAAGAIV